MNIPLKMLLPMIFPSARPGLPFKAEPVLITSSGNDVPMATIVSPMSNSLMLKRRARADAPLVSQSAPRITSTIPTTKLNMDNSIIYFFEFDSRRYTKNRKKQQIILFIAKVALTSRSDFNYGVPKEVVTKATSMKKAEIIPKNLIRVMPA